MKSLRQTYPYWTVGLTLGLAFVLIWHRLPVGTDLFRLLKNEVSFLSLILLYILSFGLFFLPGLLIGRFFCTKDSAEDRLAVAVLCSGALGYLVFWIYFANRWAGRAFSWFVLFIAIFEAISLRRRKTEFPLRLDVDTRNILGLMFWVGLFYLALLNIVYLPLSQGYLAEARFFLGPLPIDNLLPKMLADHFYSGTDPRPFFGDWLSSDRPPLQSGLYLLNLPILTPTFFTNDRYYETIGITLQTLWIPAIWVLARSLNLGRSWLRWALAFSIFSGFFFLNSVFLWPKLLAASFFLIAIHFLLRWKNTSLVSVVYAGMAAGLALLSHTAVLFTWPVLLFAAIWSARVKEYRAMLAAGLVFVATVVGLMLPWMAYQKFYDPPGDRLIKYHLADVKPVTARPSLEVIREAYNKLTWDQIIQNRKTDIGAFFSGWDIGVSEMLSDKVRSAEFFFLFRSLGLLNLGFFLLLPILFKQGLPKGSKGFLIGLTLATLGGLAFWVLVMFAPMGTIIHQGSYATMILLFLLAALGISVLPEKWIQFLLGIHVLLFFSVWALACPTEHSILHQGIPNLFMVGATSLAAIQILKGLGYGDAGIRPRR